MDIKEINYEDLDWIHLAWDTFHWRALVNKIMDLKVS
jgi:hypothetical protein